MKIYKGSFLNKQQWISICSAHHDFQEDCAMCNSGDWHNIYWMKINSLIYDMSPNFWRYLNNPIKQWKSIREYNKRENKNK